MISTMEQNKRKLGLWEIFALLLYGVAHLGMAVAHEPWYDETQAWQIARSAPLSAILFEVPHYEGHPPLWHLILMPFAKAGAPYELSLTFVSLLLMGTAVYLLLRYAPFPRPVRLLLPFTYFWFYQYGVISRVYCLMSLAFVLLALFYKNRNEKPGKYAAALMLLCATSGYGIVIAGGLAALWLWEIIQERGLRGYGGDRRIRWLAALLLLAIGILLQILPREDTYAAVTEKAAGVQNPFWVRLLYMLLILPADVTVTEVFSEYTSLYQVWMPLSSILSGCFLGILIWALLLYYGRKKRTTCLCVLPYALYALFSAAVYLYLHHIGIGLMYFCFWAWASMEQEGDGLPAARPEVERGVRFLAALMGRLAMGISLFWTVAACVLDIRGTYWMGRHMARFVSEHRLDQYRIMAEWKIVRDSEGNILLQDPNFAGLAVDLAPYFEHNLCFYMNEGRDDRNYVTHILPSEEELKSYFDSWRKEAPPQVLLGTPDLEAVYGETVRKDDYALVYQEEIARIWKAGTGEPYTAQIYVRKDLLEETGLQAISEYGF